MQGMPTIRRATSPALEAALSGSHVGVPAGDDVANVKRNFGVAVDGGDAEAATGSFDEAGEGGEVKVLVALQLGEVASFHTQGLSELLLGQATARRTSLSVARFRPRRLAISPRARWAAAALGLRSSRLRAARTCSVEVRRTCRGGVANEAHGGWSSAGLAVVKPATLQWPARPSATDLTRRQIRALRVPLALDNYRFWRVVVDNTRTGRIAVHLHLCGVPLVEVMGFEPTTSSMRPKRSSQLSYTPERDDSG